MDDPCSPEGPGVTERSSIFDSINGAGLWGGGGGGGGGENVSSWWVVFFCWLLGHGFVLRQMKKTDHCAQMIFFADDNFQLFLGCGFLAISVGSRWIRKIAHNDEMV